jgi:cyclohexanecarboxylate-CoA ligase
VQVPQDDYVSEGYWENKNIYTYLKEAARNVPEKIAVVDPFQRLTYKELNRFVQQLAGSLVEAGIKKGDVVSFQLPNWIEAAVIHQALLMIGAVSNPIIPIYRKKELTYILNQSKTKLLFIPYKFRNFDYLEMIQGIKQDGEARELEGVIVLDKYDEHPTFPHTSYMSYAHFLAMGSSYESIEPVKETDIALLLYTSGTTSDPKGALHTHNTLNHENKTMIEKYKLTAEDTIYMPSPVTHITGILYGLELPAMIEGQVVFQDIWDPERAVNYLMDEACTWTVGATPFLQGILQQVKEEDRGKLKLKAFACGGADVPPELIKKAAKKLGCYVTRVYGSTEYPTFSACSYEDPIDKAAHTDGRKFKGSYGKILDHDGNELLYGQVGELAVKGPEMFLGYLQEAFNQGNFTEDGFFLTGDLAVMDQEGYIEIKGRKKDIIIRGGENISVKEVEDLLYDHPHISEVAIVAMPDKDMGEKACAFIVLKEGETLDFQEMCRFLEGKGVAKQKFPERLLIIDQLPMTASGKIQKYLLRDHIKKELRL